MTDILNLPSDREEYIKAVQQTLVLSCDLGSKHSARMREILHALVDDEEVK